VVVSINRQQHKSGLTLVGDEHWSVHCNAFRSGHIAREIAA